MTVSPLEHNPAVPKVGRALGMRNSTLPNTYMTSSLHRWVCLVEQPITFPWVKARHSRAMVRTVNDWSLDQRLREDLFMILRHAWHCIVIVCWSQMEHSRNLGAEMWMNLSKHSRLICEVRSEDKLPLVWSQSHPVCFEESTCTCLSGGKPLGNGNWPTCVNGILFTYV